MISRRLLAVSVAVLLYCPQALAEEVICPASIEVEQKIQSIPGGFAAYVQDGPHQTSGISLFAGDPVQLAMLKPDNGDDVATRYKYSLGESADDYWVVCHYALTEVALKRKIESRVTYCESLAGKDLIHRMNCR